MVGSTVVETTRTTGQRRTIDRRADLVPARSGDDRQTGPVPQTGRAWRPSVDPTGRLAVYWTGTCAAPTVPPASPRTTGGSSSATGGPATPHRPTRRSRRRSSGDQAEARHETTIAAGQMADWDARWDKTGTQLAVWIADPQNPAVGRLSLYAVDPFDGRIDLKKPLLDAQPARPPGYSISDGKLVWAEPAADGSDDRRPDPAARLDRQGRRHGRDASPDTVIVIR